MIERIAFAIGVVVLTFVVGVAVGKLELFPHDQITQVGRAASALYRELVPEPLGTRRVAHERGGVTRAVTPGEDSLKLITVFERDGARASLIDGAGAEVHAWRTTFSEVWGDRAPHLERQGEDRSVHWRGGHVFPDGDFLFNFEGGGFPYGGGLVRLDRHSRVRWKVARNTHHDFTVLADGGVVTPSQQYRWEGIEACAPWLEPPYYEDQVLIVSAAGEVQETISVLGAFCGSDYRSLLMRRGAFAMSGGIEGDDVLHLNDAELVTAELAARFPMARAGDILVSLRNVNALAFIARDTGKVRWLWVGPFARQHDPDLLPNGHIMLFDNHGGRADFGGSRVLELDPVTQGIVWSYEGTARASFRSSRAGSQTVLPNGNVLIGESWGGRVLEVTRAAEPQIVWEYVTLRDADDGGGVPNPVMGVTAFDRASLPFLNTVEAAN